MIPAVAETIQMEKLSEALQSFASLRDLKLAEGSSLFAPEHTETLDQVQKEFLAYLSECEDPNGDIRRAFGWLLNQPQEDFENALVRIQMPYPGFEPQSMRKLLEWLWQKAFADWKIENFSPKAYPIMPETYSLELISQ